MPESPLEPPASRSRGDSGAEDGLTGLQIAGITAVAIGVVGLGVGIGAGVVAMNEQQSLDDELARGSLCPGDPTGCAAAQSQVDSDIKPIAHLSTTGFVIGGASLTGGLVLLLLGRDDGDQATALLPSLNPTSAGLTAVGRF